ncbi:MAG: hypothetical protein V1645_00155 [archaeon]
MGENALKLRDDALNFVRSKGPVLPVHVGERFGFNSIIASAVLSDLVSNGLVKLSNTKIGGSPVYFVPGQEPKLQGLYKYLGEKPRKIYDMLRDSKVLRDKVLEPWQRVAVREIKDFSVMLRVNYSGNEEIFWKWYLASDEEAKGLIAEIIRGDVLPPEPKKEEKVEEKVDPVPEPVKEVAKPIEEVKEEVEEDDPDPVDEEVVEHARETPKFVDRSKKVKRQKSSIDFYQLVRNYFTDSRIKVLEENIVRRNTELNFVVTIPSSVGPLRFFVIAKNKKAINDAELSMAYSQSQLKKLPVLFLSNGDLSKKASSYLEANIKGYLSFKKIGS